MSKQKRHTRRQQRRQLAEMQRLLAHCQQEGSIPDAALLRATKRGWVNREGAVILAQLPHTTVHWLSNRWCITDQHLTTGKILRYYAQEAGKVARWLSEATSWFR